MLSRLEATGKGGVNSSGCNDSHDRKNKFWKWYCKFRVSSNKWAVLMPDIIFHIGLHKTATTSLQNQFFPAIAELNFIRGHGPSSPDFLLRINRTDPAYFDPRAAMNKLSPFLVEDKINLMSSESFSWVSWSGSSAFGVDFRSQILRNLAAAVPDARIILVLRRQDGMVRSLYRQYLQAGGTKPIDKVFGASPDTVKSIVPRNYFRYGPYVRVLNELFPAGVLVLTFEELASHPELFLNKLAGFIGVECPKIALQKSNASQFGSFGLEVTRWLNHLFRSGLNPAGFLPGLPIKRGSASRVPLSWWLHENWPYKAKLSESCLLHRRSMEIFDQMREDNVRLDREYALGLSKYGYC